MLEALSWIRNTDLSIITFEVDEQQIYHAVKVTTTDLLSLEALLDNAEIYYI